MANTPSMWKAMIGIGAAGLLSGCGSYTSDYVPPNDGRARAIWDDDRVVASLPEGSMAGCTDAVDEVRSEPRRYSAYYGGSTRVVVYRPWIVVHHHHHVPPPVFVGPGHAHPSPGGVVRTPATPGVSGSKGSSGGSKSGSSGSSGGGNGDIGKAAIVLVVVALVTLPIITLGLGLGRPEPSGKVATAIDEVNAYNDLARLPGSPCSATVVEVAP